jgi:arsenate reductase
MDELERLLQHRKDRELDELAAEFAGVWSRETIERMVEACKRDLIAARSGLSTIVVMAPRFARQRLEALALAEERIEKAHPEVLFVCVRNAGRSQMAAGLTHHLSDGEISVRSAGSLPGHEIHQAVV